MDKPQDAGNYQVDNNGTVQGQVIGDNATVNQYFYAAQNKALSSSSKPQRVWNIPYPRNPFFTGRQDLLSRLQEQLRKGQKAALSQPQAISGLGGIGKTQISVHYAYKHCQEYQSILWARAESHETLTSSFVEIARLLNLPQKDEQDQTMIVQAVKRWLQDNTGWLLILDNADEPAIVREFLPTKCAGHILLTTRAQALAGLAQRIEVDTFMPELGALFLLRRVTLIAADGAIDDALQSDREIAVQISKELGGLPLALDQAGAYIEQAQCSLSDYLSLYRTRRAEMLKERGSLTDDHPDSVATTWSLSFQRVEEKNAAAAHLLRLCAFLAPDAIPEEIVLKGASYFPHAQVKKPSLLTKARHWFLSLATGTRTSTRPLAENTFLLDEAMRVLRAYSLIIRDPAEKTLSVHRLVQAVLRDVMSDEETRQWEERAVRAVSKACPDVEFAMWKQWERYLPHALACADLIEQGNLMLVEAAFLLNEAGYYLYERGRYSEAEPLWVRALEIREQQLSSDHPNTALSLNSLAALYYAQGKYEQAEPLYVRALSIYEQQLGPQHPDTATNLNNLAALYRSQGKYEQAEPLYVRALSIYEQQLGPQHPDTANSLNNLAELYRSQGKDEQAEPLYVRALPIYEQQLGPQHPNTANSLNNLAGLYRSQGKDEQAEPLYIRALSIYEQQLGPEHPYTASSFNNLAGLYHVQDKYEQAESLYIRALKIREQQLGPEHPNTATSLNNLAGLYRSQGSYEQAEPLYIRALVILKQSLGPQHPNTRAGRQNYANLLRAMGRDKEANQLEESNEPTY